ncbi:D-aminoacyl-tRNA deacylase [Rhodoferax sp. GW822-FHT02A01]|uniref:D-aminoacyl-tRNA deacylase n=1 Tax=Rhodoferax sp. GW822-FHT02A01 TaxID=3141537 RepID=UPI00315D9B25
MLALVQRVSRAKVTVEGEIVGEIGRGFLVLVCAEQGDTTTEADKLLAKLLKLRVFGDAQGKMNLSIQNIDGQGTQGGLLIVSQFTLAADLRGGNRPSFTNAAAPDLGRQLFDHFVAQARAAHPIVQTGRFATEMAVELVNDGPITIPMRIEPAATPQ